MESFIPVYPSPDDPDIQRIITAKKEFNELRPELPTKIIRSGDRSLRNSQELFARLTTVSDRMLNMHGTGKGKTCAFIAASEMYKGKNGFKGCYIVQRSEELLEQTRKQIQMTCTPEGEYTLVLEEAEDTEELTDRIRRKRRNQSLNSWYKWETYDHFTSVLKELAEAQIYSLFNKYIFIFDEAHNIITEKEKSKDKSKDKVASATDRYQQYLKLCHNIPQSKILLITATPMTNSPDEAIKLVNLILPADRQIPIKPIYRMAELEPYLRGKISYIKTQLPDVEVEYQGTPFYFKNSIFDPHPTDKSKDPKNSREINIMINMYLTKMGDLQDLQFREIIEDDTKNYLRAREKGISTIVFPIIDDIETTSKDFIDEIGSKMTWKAYPNFTNWEERGNHSSFQSWLGDLDNLARLSGKTAEIIKIEESSPGCSFIYNSLVNKPGVKFLSMVFSLYGYEIFSEISSENIFISGSNKIKESFKKRKRIALLVGGSSSSAAKQNAIIDLFNSDANVNGEYIKIIIGSKIVRDGYNFFHCQRMHLFFPDWHYTGMIQAINRALRVGGHAALKAFKIREAESRGLIRGTDEYIEATKIKVKIYRHCIDFNLDENIRGIAKDNSDYAFMKTAVSKEVRNTMLMNIFKSCAVDALINREDNALDLDDPFNFDKTRFLPSWTEIKEAPKGLGYIPFETDPTDYSTYKVLYLDLKPIKEKLIKILTKQRSISYEAIFDYFKDHTREELYEAISSLTATGHYVPNSFGEKMYLDVSENGLQLQRFYSPAYPGFIKNIAIYDQPTIVSMDRTLSSYLEIHKNDMIKDLFLKFVSVFDPLEWMLKKDRWIHMGILEELMLYKVKRPSFDYDITGLSNLLGIFKGYLFEMIDPIANGRVIYIHSLNNTIDTHAILSNHINPKNIKVLFPDEPLIGWRLPISVEEDLMCKNYIEVKVKDALAKYDKFKMYGTILQDGTFRIYEKDLSSEESTDKRTAPRGSNPSSDPNSANIPRAVAEKIVPSCKIAAKSEPIEYLREALLATQSKEYVDSLTDEEVLLYHRWLSCTNVQKYFVEGIMEKMKKDGRLYDPYLLHYEAKK
jgi:superfamily II DNA or RNA helicase